MNVKFSYPLPRMDECLESLGEAEFFRTLDCNSGYWQIPLAEGDRAKTTFTSRHMKDASSEENALWALQRPGNISTHAGYFADRIQMDVLPRATGRRDHIFETL